MTLTPTMKLKSFCSACGTLPKTPQPGNPKA
ncbi:uncharacterized protein CTRU02_215215 [Colletotrichum truncatum]|uniref:Uncharacterized protein n=1 Tax=Colletotrichum truncatum TaxID=5467 RepID=A0ACC3YD94_COLTU|nr:uncharacterized protein CTRU02_12257 [Colletotrichum truncatum]KAF6784796.1 hypothetical protein CTRU02_12257 [Colletotrichum truncatum]